MPCSLTDFIAKALDRADFAITLARLSILDWRAGPLPENEADRIRKEEAERLRRAFPDVDFCSAEPVRVARTSGGRVWARSLPM
jgi:hypothetical protein